MILFSKRAVWGWREILSKSGRGYRKEGNRRTADINLRVREDLLQITESGCAVWGGMCWYPLAGVPHRAWRKRIQVKKQRSETWCQLNKASTTHSPCCSSRKHGTPSAVKEIGLFVSGLGFNVPHESIVLPSDVNNFIQNLRQENLEEISNRLLLPSEPNTAFIHPHS